MPSREKVLHPRHPLEGKDGLLEDHGVHGGTGYRGVLRQGTSALGDEHAGHAR